MNNVVIVGAGKEGKGTFGDIFYEKTHLIKQDIDIINVK